MISSSSPHPSAAPLPRSAPIRVGIVEDNDAIRESLALILDGAPGMNCRGAAARTAEEALRIFADRPLDVVLMDINLPRQSGIECARQLKALRPQLQIIMLTIEDDSAKVLESLKAGATGYLVKNLPPAQIVAAVEEVHRGGSPMSSQIARLLVQKFQEPTASAPSTENLTSREQEVLALTAKGFRSKEIADALSLSPLTVQTHFRNIYEKLQVRSRAEAVATFLQR
jgi:DNA-binding NarL/FixJ family response regulator